jgi:hypothetical protein
MNMWVGWEQEGKNKGKRTLFIGSNKITVDDINEAAKYQAFEQIYFGAGVCTKINYNIVRQSIKLFPKHIITLEVDYKEFKEVREEFIANNVEFILTITDRGFSKLSNMMRDSVQIKIQSLEGKNKFIALALLKDFKIADATQLIKKTYKGDKVLK